MRLSTRHSSLHDQPGVSGTVRIDRRTGPLLERLRPGDVAVIDHLDLDRASAEALVDSGVVAVVNASSFISGRFPNLGPDLLSRSGVLMVDAVGSEVFGRLRDGERVRVHGGAVLAGDQEVASGTQLAPEDVASRMQGARSGLATQLQAFTHNTTEFLRREHELLLHGQGVPGTRTSMEGRPVVVVADGHDVRADLRLLRRFIREQRPVLVGVDAGADALIAAGHRPDIVVVGGEGLSQGPAQQRGSTVSDKALRAAREIVLHTDRSGHAAGSDRLDRLGFQHGTLAASGMSEDMALLLADVGGASLVVTVGTHATLEELVDRQRAGLSSTFLTRVRVGPKLVDAKAVPLLYAGRVRLWHLVLVLLAGLVALAVAVLVTPVGQEWWSSSTGALPDVLDRIEGLLP
jgi:uncharacterized membrane-anchored protein